MTPERNKENRIALFEAAVKDLLETLEFDDNAQSVSQAVCLEHVSGKTVQIQITVQTDESEFIDDFTTVVNRLYSA